MKQSYEDIFTFKVLYKLYIDERLSTRDIAKLYNISKTPVQKYLKKFNISRSDMLNTFHLSNLQKDFIIGSRLGDGTFSKDNLNYRMSFRHAENQKAYLAYKFNLMEEFCKKKSIGKTDWNKKISGNAQTMYYFHTRALPIFGEYAEMTISDCFKNLNSNVFTIWLMDDGSYYNKGHETRSPYYTLSIKRFSEREKDLALKVFEEKLGLRPSVNKLGKNGYLYSAFYFPTSQTQIIHNIIKSSNFAEMVNNTMHYKVW